MTSSSPSKQGILLLTNFLVDMGNPGFRVGTYQHYLLPLAKILAEESPENDVRLLIGKHALDSLRRLNKAGRSIGDSDFVIDPFKRVDLFGYGDGFVEKSYSNSFSDSELASLEAYFREVFGDFEPSVIICWEFPINFLRRIFPDAVVVDLMPGTFMRPPYTKTVAVDPWGIYKDSGLRELVGGNIRPTDAEVASHLEVRDYYADYFVECRAREKILSLFPNTGRFSSYKLVPLQISSYFGFHANCNFRSQFDFLLHVLQNTPSDVGVIATQYTGSLTSENSINPGNLDFLRKNFEHFLYSERFDLASNISQYIVPWADETCSVSSTLGLQANFLNRRLVSPSTSHLSFLQNDRLEIPAVEAAALIQSRYSLPWDKLLHEKGYFSSILEHLKTVRKTPGQSPYEGWPLTTEPRHIKTCSTFERASEILKQIGPLPEPFPDETFMSTARQAINKVETVSFDVFDTLVTRPVFLPSDIFLLIGCHIRDSYPELLPGSVSPSLFATLRQSAERELRRYRDAELLVPGCSLPEEISIHDIYQNMVNRIPNMGPIANELVRIESEIELSLIGPIPMGVELYQHAKASGKRLLIISDFCHPKQFVEDCLKKAGVDGYEHCYVSSDSGPKKHSGGLYHLIEAAHGLNRKIWLHIGDNPDGDIKAARNLGIRALRFPNFRRTVTQNLSVRGIPDKYFRPSFAMRTSVSLFSQRYTPPEVVAKTPAEDNRRNIVESRGQLGYLGLGPLILGFAKWAASRALANGCRQIVFFARDCHLPALALEKLIATDPAFSGLRSFYVPASRSAVKGFGIHHPDDVYKVSLSDFAKGGAIGQALWQRFGIDPADIACELYEKHGISDAAEKIESVPLGAIYGLIHDYVSANWETISHELSARRTRYKNMLAEYGIDTSLSTALVDIGYLGTITKAVSSLFEAPTSALFMFTYADDFGRDPIEGCEAYLADRQRQSYQLNSPFLKHNLILETLLNEPAGSLIQLFADADSDGVEIIKEQPPSAHHIQSVREIHEGVTHFLNDWFEKLGTHARRIHFEPNLLLMVLHQYLEKPTFDEARLLAELVFDNAYAGHQVRKIADNSASVWKAGEKALSAPPRPEGNSQFDSNPKPKSSPSSPPISPGRQSNSDSDPRQKSSSSNTSIPRDSKSQHNSDPRRESSQPGKNRNSKTHNGQGKTIAEPKRPVAASNGVNQGVASIILWTATCVSSQKLKNYAKSDPKRFFQNSKSNILRKVGSMLFD